MAAVVHHGGAGTTHTGLRAGVPSVIVPFFTDQPCWAQRVAALGVGPRPIPRSQLTVERLARAIDTATTSPAPQARAAAVGQRVRGEHGVERAVAAFEALVAARVKQHAAWCGSVEAGAGWSSPPSRIQRHGSQHQPV